MPRTSGGFSRARLACLSDVLRGHVERGGTAGAVVLLGGREAAAERFATALFRHPGRALSLRGAAQAGAGGGRRIPAPADAGGCPMFPWTNASEKETPMPAAADATPSADRELVISRVIDAPRERVFEAWTDPDQLKRWWGPHGMTTPVCEMDLRPGGVFRTVMRDPGGAEYPNEGVFVEVAKPERLVFTEAFGEDGRPSEEARATITFEDPGGGETRLTARWLHASVADREAHERMGFAQGWGEMLDRLEAHLKGDDVR